MFAVGSSVNQRSRASPIFVGSVGEKNLRDNLVGNRAVEQAANLSGDGVVLILIGEREDVGGKENRRRGLGVSRRLREAIVEAPAPCSGHMRQYAIERDPAIFISVEAVIQKIAQKTPVLRDAF